MTEMQLSGGDGRDSGVVGVFSDGIPFLCS